MNDWIPVIAAIGGGFVSGAILLINNWINKRSEERKHLNEIMLNVALEHWKQACMVAIEKMKLGSRTSILPLESYIVYVMKLTDVLLTQKVTKNNIVDKLKEIHEISDEVTKFVIAMEESRREKKLHHNQKTRRTARFNCGGRR